MRERTAEKLHRAAGRERHDEPDRPIRIGCVGGRGMRSFGHERCEYESKPQRVA
jgi:hypothetical protein